MTIELSDDGTEYIIRIPRRQFEALGGEPDLTPLSPRQREITRMARKGLAQKEIGAKLGISLRTVKYHSGEIRRKLGIARMVNAC